MALIRCPECQREISSYCDACPHCGYPIRNDPINRGEQPPRANGIQSQEKEMAAPQEANTSNTTPQTKQEKKEEEGSWGKIIGLTLLIAVLIALVALVVNSVNTNNDVKDVQQRVSTMEDRHDPFNLFD